MHSRSISCVTGLSLIILLSAVNCKVYERCELVNELTGNVPECTIDTWVCIAKYSSKFDTSVDLPNIDGGRSLGLFQIHDDKCSASGEDSVCGISCDKLTDDDISDDIQCAKKIFGLDDNDVNCVKGLDESDTNRFLAFDGYWPHCLNKKAVKKLVEGC